MFGPTRANTVPHYFAICNGFKIEWKCKFLIDCKHPCVVEVSLNMQRKVQYVVAFAGLAVLVHLLRRTMSEKISIQVFCVLWVRGR